MSARSFASSGATSARVGRAEAPTRVEGAPLDEASRTGDAGRAAGEVEEWDAVVVGGGIAGLAAAWELTRAGLRPLLVEARGYTGGLVAAAPIGGVRMDLGAEGFVMRGEAVTEMVDTLGLDVVGPSGGGARLFLPPISPAPATPPEDSTPPTDTGSPCSTAGSELGTQHRAKCASIQHCAPPSADTAESAAHTRHADSAAQAAPTEQADLPSRTHHGWGLHRFVRDSFLGIPAHPLADDAVAVLGQGGAERAAADAELPGWVGTGRRADGSPDPGAASDLASFVVARMGQAVLDRLVRPIVAGIHTADPSELAADTVAPGLREATFRLGSLQAAVAELLEVRRRRRRAGMAADVTVPGGLVVLTDALREAIEAAGGRVETRTGAQSLAPAPAEGVGVPVCSRVYQFQRHTDEQSGTPTGERERTGSWDLVIAPTARGATPSAEPVPAGPERTVRTRRLVLACSAGAAQRLLAGAGLEREADIEVPAGSPIGRFMLVVRAPGLDPAPAAEGMSVQVCSSVRSSEVHTHEYTGTLTDGSETGPVGSGLLVAPPPYPPGSPCPVRAKALSHLSVKWPWIGEELRARHGEHVHALRLSYGRPGEPSPQVTLAQALTDASALTGVPLAEEDVIAHMMVHWDGTLPPVTPAFRARTAALVDDVAARPGLALTGAWVAGTGIAAVVEHARAQAARLVAGNHSPSASRTDDDKRAAGGEAACNSTNRHPDRAPSLEGSRPHEHGTIPAQTRDKEQA